MKLKNGDIVVFDSELQRKYLIVKIINECADYAFANYVSSMPNINVQPGVFIYKHITVISSYNNSCSSDV